MSADREHLELNLERLLRRAWQPVRARESFRSRLEQDVLAAVGRPWWHARGPRRLARSAALWLLLLGGSAWIGHGLLDRLDSAYRNRSHVGSLEEVLARGEVAWRTGKDREWAGEWTAHPRFPLHGDYLELATPATEEAVASTYGEPVLELAPSSRAVLERQAGELVASLEQGGLCARIAGTHTPLRLRTRQGELRLRSGALRLAEGELGPDSPWPELGGEPCVHLTADAGPAEIEHDSRRLRIEGALMACLRESELLLATPPAPEQAEREVSTPEPTGEATGTSAQEHGLYGRVLAAEALPERFRVVTLHEVSIPQVADPVAHDFTSSAGSFALPELAPGSYSVYVLVPGWAVAKRTGVEVRDGAATRLALQLERGVELEGVVIDARDGVPIPHAYVVSESDSQLAVLALTPESNRGFDRAVRADAQGRFRIERLSSGSQWLRASAEGYGPAWLELDELGPGEERGALALSLLPEARIEGSVLDEHGAPQSGVLVLASTSDADRRRPCLTYQPALTDDTGHYAIDGLDERQWAVLLFGPAREVAGRRSTPSMRIVQVASGQSLRVDFHPARRGIALRGSVHDAAGRPIAGRSLMLAPGARQAPLPESGFRNLTTLEDGSFRLPEIEPGWCDLFVTGRTPAELTHVGRLEIPAQEEAEVAIELPLGRITGNVHDAVLDAPMAHAIGVLLGGEGTPRGFVAKVLTDSEGNYTIEYVPDGVYDLWIHATRGSYGEGRRLGIEVWGGASVEGVDFVLEAGGSLHIEVRDARGQPLAGAEVAFLDQAGVVTSFDQAGLTDEQGSYTVAGMRPGSWTVSVGAPGHATFRSTVEIHVGATVRLPLVLEDR